MDMDMNLTAEAQRRFERTITRTEARTLGKLRALTRGGLEAMWANAARLGSRGATPDRDPIAVTRAIILREMSRRYQWGLP